MPDTRNAEVGGIGLVTVILALVFLFVWPGPFRYQYVRATGGAPLIRIDRLGGEPYVWQEGRYVLIQNVDATGVSTEGRKQ